MKDFYPIAITNYEAPIGHSYSFNKHIDPSFIFDAIYIPTMAQRNNITNIVKTCNSLTKNIFILHSGYISPTLLECTNNENVKLIDIHKVKCFSSFKNWYLSCNPSLDADSTYDLPLKRNFALEHSSENGFKYIGLIDDDILFHENDLKKALFTLDNNAEMVGFNVLDFPDKSTIEHIERFITKQPSKVSIGGNFLFFERDKICGFFPYIYNEDWFFILRNIKENVTIKSAGVVCQEYHEPWHNIQRIKFEQFGELIINGLYPYFQKGLFDFTKEKQYWEVFHNDYLSKLHMLLEHDKNNLWQTPILAAIEQVKKIEIRDIEEFSINFDNIIYDRRKDLCY